MQNEMQVLRERAPHRGNPRREDLGSRRAGLLSKGTIMPILIACALLLTLIWPGPIQAAPIPIPRLDILAESAERAPRPSKEASAELSPDEIDAALAKPHEILTEQVCEQLASAAQLHGLPVAFLARLIWQESRFNPRAVSPVGARGLAQFMPRTAAEYGLEDPFDPLAALPASARFLRELHDRFGNLGLAAAAYNAGPGRIQNWLARRGKLPEETRNYVRIITGQPAESWTVEDKTVDLALALPARAPCEGIGGLSRKHGVASVAVNLTDNVVKIIQVAEAAAAKAAVAAKEMAQKVAQAAKSAKARAAVLASRKTKPANDKADKVANKKPAGKNGGRLKLADKSGTRG